jgi:hypothetical protein
VGEHTHVHERASSGNPFLFGFLSQKRKRDLPLTSSLLFFFFPPQKGKKRMIAEDERMEEVLTRDFMGTTSGGIRLVTSRTGLNVFDTMGLEGVVAGDSISDVSSVSGRAVSMTGIPLSGTGGTTTGTTGVSTRKVLEGLDFGSDGRMNAHKAALSIRDRRVKRGKGGGAGGGGARASITDATNVDISMRQYVKAVEPYIKEFHERYAYEHTPEGRRELSERQQREAEEAIHELEEWMGFAEGGEEGEEEEMCL